MIRKAGGLVAGETGERWWTDSVRTGYDCPSCHLHLLSWDAPTKTVEIFHKVGLWEEFGTRRVRLICQSCLGATEVVPDTLVDLLRERFGYALTTDRRPPAAD